jgi:hypothetical protein
MRVYMDWEFLETADDDVIHPISVALKAEDGRELYAIFADLPLESITGHEWLMTNVMPHLPFTPSGGGYDLDLEHPDAVLVKPRDIIAWEVASFFEETSQAQLWGYYCSYDFVLLARLYGGMLRMPPGMPRYIHDLEIVLQAQGDTTSLENLVMTPDPSQCHHALEDVRHLRRVHTYLQTIADVCSQRET